MEIKEACEIINNTKGLKILNEFMNRSLSYFEMRRALKSVLPGYDHITDEVRAIRNDKLIVLKPDALEKRGISLKEFENRIYAFGWTVSGYTEKYIVLVPIHNGTRDVVDGSAMRTPRKPETAAVVNACKGYYFRFDNKPPSLIERIGFRTTKDRNMDFENPKRSEEQFWNQERVYCFSLEVLAKRCQGRIDSVINAIFSCVESGYEYGRYLYLFKDNSDRFNIDVEYGFNSISGIAGFLESNVNPQFIVFAVDTKQRSDGADAIIKELKLDKIVKDGNYRKFIHRKPEVNKHDLPEYNPRVKPERNFGVEKWD